MDKACKPRGSRRLHRFIPMRPQKKNKAAGEAVGPGDDPSIVATLLLSLFEKPATTPGDTCKLLAGMDGACRFYGDSMERFDRWRARLECVTMIFCKKDFVVTRVESKLSWQTHL